ncbi:MAG: DUF2849 domain-containing protein [Boseongicola sp. SB0664_bin_43]|uniref:DUF2849 domain-containing protein n=1 Tax=Boseongicola sp. SB0664_bin_43 TaxID=2604844 RepID=A0A6B0Y2F8_9RHOB|nr:DUF2849 domain-containing protein [Boseongicola sp. SB0664_bin_43]MYK30286.1 DUF2849 domain-containing protein [Boseongicola sp. SB0670_bin_30]
MSRQRHSPKVVTANSLLEGDTVWLTADDRWTRNISEAELLEDEAVAEDRLLFAISQPDLVVGAYLADAAPGKNGPIPVHVREALRARGPSNYFHGKQERKQPLAIASRFQEA